MAVSSVSSSSASSIYGSRSSNIISGLASGLDTESMIEGMVSGIKTKIDTQKQNQQILLWQQEAYRSISDQLVQLSSKYTSYTSSTNLMSSSFFQPSIITSLGENASKISASGSTTSDIKITSVNHLAQTETVSFIGLNKAPKQDEYNTIEGTEVDLASDQSVSNLAGKILSFEYNNKDFTIQFSSDTEYKSAQDVANEINEQLENLSITYESGSSKKLSELIEAKADESGNFLLEFKDPNESSTLKLKDSTSASVFEALHLDKDATMGKGETIKASSAVNEDSLFQKVSTGELLAGASMNVTYNGTTATIKMPEKEELEKILSSGNAAGDLSDYLQTQFDQAFGYGRVTIDDGNGNTFTPTFTVGSNDTLVINSGSSSLVGANSIFGLEAGASNRINTSKTIGELMGDNFADTKKLVINGVEINEYTADTTLDTIMKDINSNEQAGVKVSYSATTNQFVFTSKHGGTGGQIEISAQTADNKENLAATLFGSVTYEKDGFTVKRQNETIAFDADGTATEVNDAPVSETNAASATIIKGKDAVMQVEINGVKTELTSGTNTFNIDGFTVTANGTFDSGESVSFDKRVDVDKIVDAVKSFVEDYNKVLAEINEQYTTQPDHDKDYKPLTDDQKADMTEKQIEEYESKAKQGLLFGDSDLGGLSSGLRFVFSGLDLDAIGISVSSSYSDKGKLVLDESKLRSALASDPEAVSDALAGSGDGTDGAMSRLKVQLDKYASTTGATKGILIQKAGSQYSPMALLQNTLQDKIDSYDDIIDSLTDKLNDKIDYYTSKFSKLEALIAQMNSQSSYLASLGGGSY